MYIRTLNIHMAEPSAITRALLDAISARSADAPTHEPPAAAPPLASVPRIGEPWPGIDGSAYAGLSRGDAGQPDMHLVLLADEPTDKLNWQAAQDWARRIGGQLPTRDESALLYAHLRDKIDSSGWYWTSTQCSADYAWYQFFSDGGQGYDGKKYGARARAVRRFEA
jgi:hypothetical protein